MTHVRLGYRVYQMFYKLAMNSTKQKSQEDFIKSSYYEDFVKFGRACVKNEYYKPDEYAEWLITKGKKLNQWCKDSLYDEYLLEYTKREPALKALERTVINMDKWAQEHNEVIPKYFRNVSSARAVYDIKSAKISPWVIYCSDSGKDLLARFNEEQVKMITHVIDPMFWVNVFQENEVEVSEMQDLCKKIGL